MKFDTQKHTLSTCHCLLTLAYGECTVKKNLFEAEKHFIRPINTNDAVYKLVYLVVSKNLSDVTQAQMFTVEEMFYSC